MRWTGNSSPGRTRTPWLNLRSTTTRSPIACRARSPELVELSSETEGTKRLYGLDSPVAATAAYGRQCLVARRLVERGVRFVELTMVGTQGLTGMSNPWDQHTKLKEGHATNAMTVDQPVGALIKDLRARGLLNDTLVIFPASSVGLPSSRVPTDAITIPLASVYGWPAAVSRKGTSMARPMSTATGSWRRRRPSMICTPRFSICWVSTSKNSPTASGDVIFASPTSTGI